MKIKDLSGKNVYILGYGREGQAMVQALEEYAPDAHITIGDQNTDLSQEKYEVQLGDRWLSDLDRFDVIIKSPGIPPQEAFETCALKITNSTQIFLDSIDPEAIVIGVTGSKGKSTMSSLIAHILTEAGRDVQLVGNIGEASIGFLKESNKNKIFVHELSSFQLLHISRSPQIAVLTSFFPEHLDYHGDLESYKDAKKNITRFQKSDDSVFYDGQSDGATEIALCSPGLHVSYTENDSPVSLEEVSLLGLHNLKNMGGAAAVARHMNVPDDVIAHALTTFRGLPHRLQNLGMYHQMTWVDDAISTTPESTIAAIEALGEDLTVIILGGQDRGNDFSKLRKVIDASSIEHVILLGDNSEKIASSLGAVNVQTVSTMQEAVDRAKETGSTMTLLSPAAPSYDLFTSYEEKGDAFAECIRQ